MTTCCREAAQRGAPLSRRTSQAHGRSRTDLRRTASLRLTREEGEALVCLCAGSFADAGMSEASLFRKLGQMLREFRDTAGPLG